MQTRLKKKVDILFGILKLLSRQTHAEFRVRGDGFAK